MKELVDIAEENNGFVSSSQATEAGIPRRCLADLVDNGVLVKVERGLYALPGTWEDEFLVLQHRFARGVYSHETALFLHNLTDRTPLSFTMTFPRSYNATRVKAAEVDVRTCADAVLDLGLCMLRSPSGNMVRAYDVERTLCDLVRGQAAVDVQAVNPAMRAYARSKDRDMGKLLGYARDLGVERKVRNYMEVLL
ncbi:hypothetical protein C1878_13115 [Gordonibacter sp. 28C]|uniref:type IV toxin-antitoxin system AbiEi family antitoxin domain-containing protein n=1 Tax=Gordonibacter sp. 28C TaxID=2078569 RepID=UPI000DF730C4|nr:type IV toxin-antitoxin system AbiEi family antitoxin domain-containing protein [Gordonibacter sp. 28C]RDB60784.1 hypothetical protein C1878_13115 [Gordonibacter sp. 28C]